MEIELTIKKTFNAKTLKVKAGVRYWEDAEVNGVDDVEGKLIPGRSSDGYWCIEIDIDSGIIKNWEKGKTADIHYKVCDDGIYTLLDENDQVTKEIEGYVIEDLAIEDSGHGDYIIIKVNEDGFIHDWGAPELLEFTEAEEN